jgi:hypothetical protein
MSLAQAGTLNSSQRLEGCVPKLLKPRGLVPRQSHTGFMCTARNGTADRHDNQTYVCMLSAPVKESPEPQTAPKQRNQLRQQPAAP